MSLSAKEASALLGVAPSGNVFRLPVREDYAERMRIRRLTEAAEEERAQKEAEENKRRAKELADYERPERHAALVRHHAAKRRVAKLMRTPPWANQEAIRAVYEEAVRMRDKTGIEHHVDHIIPLQGEMVSGLHVENNLQILPWYENLKKHNRFEAE